MDGDLFLLPMMLVHIAPLADLEAVAEIEEADVVRPLRVRQCRRWESGKRAKYVFFAFCTEPERCISSAIRTVQ